ncbi:MAG TPA: hypothetical protein VL172_20535, partial [Kofleriaceae bacterium]|nr:hypothetical protein [Kofleriaceae bacterium]
MKVLLAALIALPGCGKRSDDAPAEAPPPAAAVDAGPAVDARPERVVLTRVTVGRIEAEGKPPVPVPKADGPLMTSLAMSGWFAADSASVPASHRPRTARLNVVVASTVIQDRRTRHYTLVAGAEATLSWNDRGSDPAPHDKVIFERDLGKARPGLDQLDELASAAAMTVVKGMAQKEAL